MSIERIIEHALHHPGRAAMIHNGTRIDYATFGRAIAAAHRHLSGLDLPRGRLAVVLDLRRLPAWIHVFALRALGMDTICLASMAQARELALREVACVVALQSQLDALPPDMAGFDGARVVGMPTSLYRAGDSARTPPAPGALSPSGGHILFTSGTTGQYKRLIFDGAREFARDAMRVQAQGLGAHTVLHGGRFPLWTAAGFKSPTGVWHAGGCVVLDDTPATLERLLADSVTDVAMVPAMLDDLLASAGERDAPPGSFRLGVGGGFVPARIAEALLRRVTSQLEIAYGATEITGLPLRSVVRGRDDLVWLSPNPDRPVEIVDGEGRPCPDGVAGELRVPLRELDATGYLDDPQTSARMFRNGCFYPGDLAMRRADGRVRVLGRAADVLNVRGQKIPVAPIEEQLQRDLGVDEACVFAGQDDAGREELAIALQASHRPDKAALDAVARRFAEFGRVRFVVMREFPRTQAGMRKVRRTELRAQLFPHGG